MQVTHLKIRESLRVIKYGICWDHFATPSCEFQEIFLSLYNKAFIISQIFYLIRYLIQNTEICSNFSNKCVSVGLYRQCVQHITINHRSFVSRSEICMREPFISVSCKTDTFRTGNSSWRRKIKHDLSSLIRIEIPREII